MWENRNSTGITDEHNNGNSLWRAIDDIDKKLAAVLDSAGTMGYGFIIALLTIVKWWVQREGKAN